jgi:soluble lytic murein transglycosylase
MAAAYPARRGRVSGALSALALLLVSLAPGGSEARGTLYKYVDQRGVVHFTNVQWDQRYSRVKLSQKLQIPETIAFKAHARARAYDPMVERVGLEHGVPPALVKAVIHAESAFNARAVSHKGAMGLMQLMPATAKSLGVQQPFNSEQNVEGGTRYLRELRERYGSWTLALAAYNAGPEAVAKHRGIPPYRETQKYVRRVLTYYRQYHPQFAAR